MRATAHLGAMMVTALLIALRQIVQHKRHREVIGLTVLMDFACGASQKGTPPTTARKMALALSQIIRIKNYLRATTQKATARMFV